MPKTIIFTGGGSAGHVTPNVALIKRLQQEHWDIHYIGSEAGTQGGSGKSPAIADVPRGHGRQGFGGAGRAGGFRGVEGPNVDSGDLVVYH